MKIERWIILSDMQVPYQDVQTLMAVEKYMAASKWDGYLNIGDFLDMDTVSSFNEGKARLLQGKSISADIEEANKLLDRHQAIIRKRNPNAKFVLLEGNHENRVERFLDEHPQFQGFFDIPILLRLKERNIEWVRSWTDGKIYTIGKANFVHGKATSAYHAKKMADDYGDNIFYGHTHDMQCIPKASRLHPNKVIVGQSIGCLCTEMPYMRGRPSKWEQGFAVFFFRPDGKFTYYTPRIFDHQFIGPDGVLYKP